MDLGSTVSVIGRKSTDKMRAFGLLCGLVGIAFPLSAFENDASIRLNHLQMKGTHNSYHQAFPLLSWSSLGYSHAPLKEQLHNQGVRQLELDLHQCRGDDFCVYHISVFDSGTSCDTLRSCLGEVKDWSKYERTHHPIFVFLELKDSPKLTQKWSFFQNLEHQILSVFNRDDLLIPDDIRGSSFTLKQAIQTKGWPKIDDVRGKVVFVLLDEGAHRDNYTFDAPALQKRLMFTTSGPDREDAAIMKLDDPIASKEQITQLVKAGFIVRTRADADLDEPSSGDYSRLEAALTAGAHIISTDVPIKTSSYEYWVELKGGLPSRCNPLSSGPSCRSQDL
jgi:hypothetical protein